MKTKTILATIFFAVVANIPASAQYQYAWQNPKLPRAERVENLLSMLTPEEKVGLMMNKSVSIDRLGIPSYNWWSEACHGVRQGGYTVYPQPIGLAAAFSEKLVYDVFSQVSDEARANWNRTDHNDPKLFNVPQGVTYYPGNPELTFYRSNNDLPDFLDYSMKNRTYRYFTGVPQYAFGYGLSYTTFSVGKGKLTKKSGKAGKTNKPFSILTVPVTNTGNCEGTETVQVYVKRLGDAGAPIKALKGFEKLSLKPGETKYAVIALSSEAFEYYDENIDELAVMPGKYQILYGTSSRDSDLQVLGFTVTK